LAVGVDVVLEPWPGQLAKKKKENADNPELDFYFHFFLVVSHACSESCHLSHTSAQGFGFQIVFFSFSSPWEMSQGE
jgi:hypothetical protein